jgi:thiol-disulfide isomerase/thioredoxin
MAKRKNVTHNDTITLVRIAIKCADCLTDFDIIDDLYQEKESKYIKHELKKVFPVFGTYIDKFSSKFLEAFVGADDESQKDLQQSFRDFSDKIWLINEEMTALFLTYAKARSIAIDVSEMNYTDEHLQYLKKICTQYADAVGNKYKNITQLKDDGGYGVQDIVKGMDELGKSIMYK